MEFIMQPMTWLVNYSGSNDAAEKVSRKIT